MEEISRLVAGATAPDVPLADRHQAFGALVARFQDMAFGCAYAILGDFHLAEEAAQEALVSAWRNLPQLRQPGAFPGWLRRIVRTQCSRLTRGKRLDTVPLDPLLPLALPDPHDLAERAERDRRVRAAIRSLPEAERLVTVLFYIGEYSHDEVAAFVGASPATVKKRLASARRRLKERMLDMVQDDLREQRPSRDAAFAERVMAFTRRLSELLGEQPSLVRCLEELAGQQDDERFREALAQISRDLQSGVPLEWAMARHPDFFPEEYRKAVRLGVYTGTLEEQLRRLAAGEAIAAEVTVDRERLRRLVSREELREFTRRLAQQLDPERSLSECLFLVAQQQRNVFFQQVLMALRETVRLGYPLSGALTGYPFLFDPDYRDMVRSGERNGLLRTVMQLYGDAPEGFRPAVSPEEIAEFTTGLAEMLGTGPSLLQTLTLLAERQPNRFFQQVLLRVRDLVGRGGALSGAMALHPDVFGEKYVGAIRQAEAAGRLEAVLRHLAEGGGA